MNRILWILALVLVAWGEARADVASYLCAPSIGCLRGDTTDFFIDEDGDGAYDSGEPNLTVNAPTTASGDETVQGTLTVVNTINTTVTDSMYWGAGATSTDGTNCLAPAEATLVASGPKQYGILCPRTADGFIFGSTIMPDGWVTSGGGDLTFEVAAVATNTPGGTETLDLTIYAQCADVDEAISGSWTANQTITAIEFAAGEEDEPQFSQNATPLDPDGSCSAGDLLFWRLVVESSSDQDTADTYILGVKMEYSTGTND